MKAEQKWKSGQGKLQKKVKKSVGLGICVFLTLLLVSQIKVVNKLAAPVLKSVISNKSNIEISWNFPYASSEVKGMAYKLPGSEEWTIVEGVTGTKGKTTYV